MISLDNHGSLAGMGLQTIMVGYTSDYLQIHPEPAHPTRVHGAEHQEGTPHRLSWWHYTLDYSGGEEGEEV